MPDQTVVQVDQNGNPTAPTGTLGNIDQFLVDIGNLVTSKYQQAQQTSAQITQQQQTTTAEVQVAQYGSYLILVVLGVFVLIVLIQLFQKFS